MKRTPLFLMSTLILPFALAQAEPTATEKDSSAAFSLFSFDKEELEIKPKNEITSTSKEEAMEEALVFDDLFDEPIKELNLVPLENVELAATPSDSEEELLLEDMFAESAAENNDPLFVQIEPNDVVKAEATDHLFISDEPLKSEMTAPFEVQNAEVELVKETESDLPSLLDARAEPVAPALAEAKISPINAAALPKIDIPTSRKANLMNASPAIEISLKQVYAGSPIIYTVLLAMSVASLFICLYNTLSLRTSGVLSETLMKTLRQKLTSNQFDEALALCLEKNDNFFCKMLASGISTRRHGLPVILETMKAEGKRATTAFWQRMALLNDIAIIAPMIGLLGTVLGMFYAFYDLNRSIESISTLFDGLGISVGTTVAGLIVAVLAMIFQSMTKYRLVRQLAAVENEAQAFATLLDSNTTVYPR